MKIPEVKLQKLSRFILEKRPKTVLDIGCGDGRLVDILREKGIDAYGIDLEPNVYRPYLLKGTATLLPWTDNTFDIVISNDFFEHIAEKDIDKVYSEMRRVCKGDIIARICVKKEPIKIGHITIKPMSWWKEKLPNCQFIEKW